MKISNEPNRFGVSCGVDQQEAAETLKFQTFQIRLVNIQSSLHPSNVPLVELVHKSSSPTTQREKKQQKHVA